MGTVTVSASRVVSMLENRHLTTEDLAAVFPTPVGRGFDADADLEMTLPELVALGKFFKRPWSYLLIDEPEVIETVGTDNRSHRNQKVPPSPSLLDQIDAVAEMLATAADLFPDTTLQVPADLTPDTSPTVAGNVIRAFLGVHDTDQLTSKDEFSALRLWADSVQRQGVYVSQRRLGDPTVRAFSRVDEGHAVIVVDTGDGAYARIFSLLHEYTHISLRSAGICDLDDHSGIERYCNAVAAATLMPRPLVDRVMAGRRFPGQPDPDDDLLRTLSKELRVSQAALLIRLRELGIISGLHYTEMEYRRSQRRPDQERTPGGTFYPPRINRVGRRFAREVFEAYDGRQIDRQDASTALEIGEHLLATYREEFHKSEARS